MDDFGNELDLMISRSLEQVWRCLEFVGFSYGPRHDVCYPVENQL